MDEPIGSSTSGGLNLLDSKKLDVHQSLFENNIQILENTFWRRDLVPGNYEWIASRSGLVVVSAVGLVRWPGPCEPLIFYY